MKPFCLAVLVAVAALGAAAFEKTVTEGAPAPVKLMCEKPGAWTLDAVPVAGTEKGVFELEVRLAAAKEETPPAFTVRCEIPQRDAPYLWRADGTFCGVPPVWGGLCRSQLAKQLPVYTYFRADGQNAMTVAASEAKRDVGFRCGVVEEGSLLRIQFTFFDFKEAPRKDYTVRIRFDGRDRPYSDAVREASDWITATAALTPAAVPEAAFEPLYSSWYCFHQDLHDTDIEAECAIAAKLGMKVLIVDDGWQTDDTGRGYAFCGDWQISKRRFPDMAAHVARVHKLGMKYMVWYSVPFVGFKSANHGRFKGKYLRDDTRLGASVLDPRFPEVREFLIGTYEKALREWDIDGFKLDFIGSFTGSEEVRGGGRDIDTVPEATDRLMKDVYARLNAIKPGILIEFRQGYIGPAIRQYGNMLRVGDCPGDYLKNRSGIARLRLTSGGTAVHADMLEWHPTESAQEAARYVLNCLFGTIQYSMMLRKLPEDHIRMIRHWIDFTTTHRNALLKGEFRPHHPELNYPLIEGADAAERVIGVYAADLAAKVADDGRTVYVVNATPSDKVLLDFASAPKSVEAFDTFGTPVPAAKPSAGLAAVACPPSGYLKITFPSKGRRIELALEPDEKWWGLATGRGRQMPFDATSDLTIDLRTDISQSCAPLLVSNRGRIIWSEKPLAVTFAKGRMTVVTDGAEIVQDRCGTTLREAFRAASAKFFPPQGTPDLVFFDSPQLNTWIELTYNQNEKEILAYAESMVTNGVKPGIFMIDDTWQLGYGTWEFDPRRFPDPKGMCDKLHKMGFTVMLWMCPWVSPDTPAYRAIAKYGPFRGPGGFILDAAGEPYMEAWWNGKSALVDMTHPKGRAWMEGQLVRLTKEFGADGFKLDGGASYHYAREGMFPYDKTATPPDQTRAWDLLTEKFPKSDCCHLWKMGGRKVVTRLHDKNHSWEDLRRIIPDLIACGMVGTPFVCPDMIGGGQFASFLPGSPFEEDLFVRSCQVHVFAPMMQFSASPWRVLSPANQEIIRKMLALRKRFQNRICLQALESGRTGEPMLRAMEYQFPGQGYAAIKDQFMMGDFLLVAPQLVKGATTREVAIPPGRWVSDEGELVVGPKTVTVKTPLDRLPFFLRNSPAAETSAAADGVTIDTKLPGGNAIIEKFAGSKVILKQDLRDSAAPWFHWAVRVLGAGGRHLDFEFTDMRALSNRGAAYSLDKGKTWTWTHDREPENAHTFSFDFPKGADEVWFRQQIPYTHDDWKAFLARHADKKDWIRTGSIPKTRLGNPVLTAEIGKLDVPRHRVMLTSRHHAQEATGTWVMEGILEAALGDDELGKWFRENVCIRAVPFVDTDGVLNGDQGKGRHPHDHNRDYSLYGEEVYPEIRQIEALAKVEKPAVLIDLHSPWIGGPKRWESSFYQVGSARPGCWAQQQAFAKLLAKGTSGLYRIGNDIPPGVDWNGGGSSQKNPRTADGWWRAALPKSFSTCFEIPFANDGDKTLGPDDWKAFGRDVAAAIRQWLVASR